jgi:hypothetical protein
MRDRKKGAVQIEIYSLYKICAELVCQAYCQPQACYRQAFGIRSSHLHLLHIMILVTTEGEAASTFRTVF